MKIILILPTLNEKKNILPLYKELKLIKKKIDILFIDDNSIDGTKNLIKKLKKKTFFLFLEIKNMELALHIKKVYSGLIKKNMTFVLPWTLTVLTNLYIF